MAEHHDTTPTTEQWRDLANDYSDLLDEVLLDCSILLPRAMESFADVGNDNPPGIAHRLVAILLDRITDYGDKEGDLMYRRDQLRAEKASA